MIESYLGLFLTAFLAATIVPFSSEALLVAMQVSGGFPVAGLLAAASLGNTLGALANWGLGRFCLHWRDRKWFPVKRRELEHFRFILVHIHWQRSSFGILGY